MTKHSTPAPAKARGALPDGLLPFVLGSALLGTLGVFVHEAQAHALTATWFRCVFGLLALSAWAAATGRLRGLWPARRQRLRMVGLGLLMVAGWVLFFMALARIGIGVATVLFHIQPLWVLLLGAWWLGETISPIRLAAVLVAMLGLVLTTGVLEALAAGDARAGRVVDASYWLGVALCLGAALCTTWVTLLARQLRGQDPVALAWWQCAVGAAVLWVWPVLDGWPAWGASWAWLAGLGVIHTGLAYVLIYRGMGRLGTDRIAVLQFSYPAVAVAIDWWVYGHALGRWQLLGVALMAGALWVAARPAQHTPRPASTQAA